MTTLRTPRFYKDFRCKGGACRKSCCNEGWEIDVDSDTQTFYKAVPGEFGKRLAANIRDGHFVLNEKGKCPFLNADGLCDIQKEFGEEHLCAICREHPRFVHAAGNLVERGVSVCCEKAAELLFKDPAPLTFVDYPSEEPPEPLDDEERGELEFVLRFREHAFAILQNRTESLAERVNALLKFTADECEMPFLPATFSAEELRGARLDALRKCETLGPEWDEALVAMAGMKTFTTPAPDFEYEHWMVYTLFRNSLEAVFSGDIALEVQFSVFTCAVLRDLDAALYAGAPWALEKRIRTAGLLASELEYSPECRSTLDEVFCEWPALGLGALGKMF